MRKEVNMCEHNRLQYVGHKGVTRVFCADCGKELDKSFLEGKNSVKKPSDNKAPADDTPRKKPAKTGKKTAKKGE